MTPTRARTRTRERVNAVAERYAKHVNPEFVRLLGVLGYGRVFTRAKGTRLVDDKGREYLDLLAGFGSVPLGHNHPRVIAALKRLLDEDALHFCHIAPSAAAGELAEALVARLPAPLDVVLYSSSGAEAVEGAMKLARAATGRPRFVSCEGGFHGTNPGALSLMGADRLRKPFEPLLAGCVRVPFGDLTRLADALAREDVAAFVVEPIQGEGGAVLPPAGYLKEAAALCRKHGTLFVADEIQTGLGRTGAFLACEAEHVVPDVVTLAKGLSGGVVPIAATVTSRAIHRQAYGTMERFDLHSSTYAGNALGCTAALETLRVIDDESLASRAASVGARLRDRLKLDLAGHPLVREVRGRGLMIAIELGPTGRGALDGLAPSLVEAAAKNVYGQWAALKLLEAGFVAQPASHRWNVLKLTPPLVLSDAEADDAAAAITRVLGEYRSLPKLLAEVAARIGSQAMRGGEFR